MKSVGCLFWREREQLQKRGKRREAVAAAAQPIVLVSTAFFNSNWSRKKSAEHTHGSDLWSRPPLSFCFFCSLWLLRRRTELILSDRKYHHHRDSIESAQDTRGIARVRVRIANDKEKTTTKTKGRKTSKRASPSFHYRTKPKLPFSLLPRYKKKKNKKKTRWEEETEEVIPNSVAGSSLLLDFSQTRKEVYSTPFSIMISFYANEKIYFI